MKKKHRNVISDECNFQYIYDNLSYLHRSHSSGHIFAFDATATNGTFEKLNKRTRSQNSFNVQHRRRLFTFYRCKSLPSLSPTHSLYFAFPSPFCVPFLSPNGHFLQQDILWERFCFTQLSPGGSAVETYFMHFQF